MKNSLLSAALDALPSPIAIVDQQRIIVHVNQAWRLFANDYDFVASDYGVGRSYSDYFAKIKGDANPDDFEQSIRKVIAGDQVTSSLEYSCHISGESKWFVTHFSAFTHENDRYVLVMDENITARKISENHFKNVLENAPIGMAIVSLDGNFLEGNIALERLLGYSRQELLAIGCKRLIYPDDIAVGEKWFGQLLIQKQGCLSYDSRLIAKDGNMVFSNITISLLHDDAGEPVSVLKQIQDVSDRASTENALRNSERRLNMLLNNTPGLIAYWNKNLTNEFVNKTYHEWFGIDPKAIKGRHFIDVVGKDLYSMNAPYIEKVLQGEPQTFERIITDAKGNEYYTLISYIPDIEDEYVKGFYVLITDVSKIKAAELELRKSIELSEILLNLSIDGFIFCDLQGKFLEVSQSFCEMLDYSKSELLTKSVPDIDVNRNKLQALKHIEKIVDNGFDHFETMHRRRDGEIIDVEVSVAYLPNKGQLVAFIRDITPRKQIEKLRIQNLVQQRDVLIREIHHRIKNHLQGMVGFLGLYPNTSLESKKLIHDIASKISSIAVVYGIQGKRNHDKILLSEIINEICESLTYFGSSYNLIRYSASGDGAVSLSAEIAVPIAVVINELIVNAIKHGAGTSIKTVVVTLGVDSERAVLTVTNDAPSECLLPDYEVASGFGVGLSLVHAMLPRDGARLSLKRIQDSVRAALILTEPVVFSHSLCLNK